MLHGWKNLGVKTTSDKRLIQLNVKIGASRINRDGAGSGIIHGQLDSKIICGRLELQEILEQLNDTQLIGWPSALSCEHNLGRAIFLQCSTMNHRRYVKIQLINNERSPPHFHKINSLLPMPRITDQERIQQLEEKLTALKDKRPPIQFCTDSHILCFVPYLSCIFIPVTY